MRPEDIPAAVALEQGSLTAWSPQHLEDEFHQSAGFQLAARDPATGKLLGLVCGRLAADEAEILKLAVAPEVRRQGIGARLLDAALHRCREKGAAACFLELRVSNTAAKRLYEKKGFNRVGTRRGYYAGPTEDAVMMRRNLQNEERQCVTEQANEEHQGS